MEPLSGTTRVQGVFSLYPQVFGVGVVILAVLALSGCLSRSSGPGLPYVKPAYSGPNPNPDPATLNLSRRLQELEMEVQRLRDMVERLQAQVASGAGEAGLASLSERVAFLERHVGVEPAPTAERPTGAVERPPVQPLPRPQASLENASPRMDQPAAPPLPDQQVPMEIRNAPLSDEEKEYRHAYSMFRRGSLASAIGLFDEFLKHYPKSPFASDAVYWIGEARFNEGRYEEAVLHFDRVIKEFPGSKKELSALLKQGQAFEKMGDPKSAKIIFQRLVQEHPHTAQARLAAGRLKSLPKD